jgi:hypothetical protein
MRANQNSSRELGLCPKYDPTHLIARSRPHSYWKAIGLCKRDRNGNYNGSTPRCKQDTSKSSIDQNRTTKINPLPVTHFIKHLECETKKSSEEHNEH